MTNITPLQPPTAEQAVGAEKEHLHWTLHRHLTEGGKMLQRLPDLVRKAITMEAWHGRRSRMGTVASCGSFREWVTTDSPEGLGTSYEQLIALVRHSDQDDAEEVVAMVRKAWGSEVAERAGAPEGNANRSGRNDKPSEDNCCDTTIETREGTKNTADYTRARLARDADPERSKLSPDQQERAVSVLQEVDAGERSPNSAAIEMGYRKKQGRIQQFRSVWRNATEDERAQIEQEIADWRRAEVR